MVRFNRIYFTQLLFLIICWGVNVQAQSISTVNTTLVETGNGAHHLGLNAPFFVSLIANLLFVFILIRFVYYPIYLKKDFFFTFFLFNTLVFIITYLFNSVELSTGAAFGIFAIFSLLRYRTEDIAAKDMTYLFIVIALGLVNAILQSNSFDILIVDSIVVGMAFALDGNLFIKNELIQTIQYDNMEMIKPINEEALMSDLKNRTGLNIHKVRVGKIDFVKNSASIKVFYYA